VPFLIGMQASNQLFIESLFPLIFICVVPLFLFQIASHIFQAIGDYEADKEEKITTFVVRYGKEKSAKIAVLFSSLSLVIPIVYGVLNFTVTKEIMYWYLLILLIFLPLVIYLIKLSANPTSINIERLMSTSRRFTPILLLAIYMFVLVLRVYLP